MAKNFCIPIVLAEKLKKAAQDGEINIPDMFDMTSAQRRGLFEKFADKEVAAEINAGFEKAMISTQKNALTKWTKETFVGSEKMKARQKDVFKKIDELSTDGLLTPANETAFLQDLVAQKLGLSVTSEEGKQIYERSQKLEAAAQGLEHIGDPTENPEGQVAYFKELRSMENYLDSLKPAGKLKVATSTIARGNMLLHIGSMLVNIVSNTEEGAMGVIVRRAATHNVLGSNLDYQRKLQQFQSDVYLKTGYDLTRMTTLDSDRKTLGEQTVHSQGPGLIRAVGRFYEDKVFGLTQGLPDVKAAAFAGADRGDLRSTAIARGEGLSGDAMKKRALEIFKDASQVEPTTKEGKLVKQEMIADSERSTNTDKRFLADRALKIRNVLNVGDLRFGDLNIPFVKTTANAIQSGLEVAGITLPIEVPIRMLHMIKLVSESGGGEGFSGFKQNAGKKSAWGEASKEAWSGFGDIMVRAGIGTLAAFLLANAIKKEDYIGFYPTTDKERQLLELKNATPNSIRVGGNWYSLSWFGPLASSLIGQLNARKYGKDPGSAAYYYYTGAANQALATPGIDYIKNTIASLTTILGNSTQNTPENTIKDIGNYLVDYVASRSLVGMAADIAMLTDTVQRDTSARNDMLAPVKNKIPGFRETLPPNKTVFGDTTPTEGIQGFLFGSRVKTVRDNAIIRELDALDKSGNLPSITDVTQTSPKAQAFKDQVGQAKFDEAMTYFQTNFKNGINRVIQLPGYKSAPEEKKKQIIENVKTEWFNAALGKYGYKKPVPTFTKRQ